MANERVLALVLNDKAGALLGGADPAHDLRARLEGAGVTVRPIAAGTLPDRVREAAESGAGGVVVAGGDGTVACAAQLLAGRDLTLGIVPMGTMNLLAHDLGLPIGDVAAAANVLAAGHSRAIDVGQIGDHVFACACMLGAPARIGHHREVARQRGNGPLAWVRVARAALRTLRRGHRLRLILRIDGHATALRTHALTITVNALDDASGRAFGRTRLDAGVLCAYAIRHRGAWDLLRLALRLATGSSRDPALPRLYGRTIEVEAAEPSLRILIDGEEHVLQTPLRFAIRPAALRVFAPA